MGKKIIAGLLALALVCGMGMTGNDAGLAKKKRGGSWQAQQEIICILATQRKVMAL